MLTDAHAVQISSLLNERNELTRQYTSEHVLEHSDNYLCHYSDSGEVVACVEVKMVQWYQAEILHLTVAEAEVHKGHAKRLLCEAERVALSKGARILQCTIRINNGASRQLFEGAGFLGVNTFFNQRSGNNIGVFQKVLVSAR